MISYTEDFALTDTYTWRSHRALQWQYHRLSHLLYKILPKLHQTFTSMGSLSLLDSDLPPYNEAATDTDRQKDSLVNSQGPVTHEDYQQSLTRNDHETTYSKADSKLALTSAEIRPVSSSLSSTHWGPDRTSPSTATYGIHRSSKLKSKLKRHRQHGVVAHKQRPRWLGNGSRQLVSVSEETSIKDPERWRRRRHQAAKVATAVGGVALVALLIII